MRKYQYLKTSLYLANNLGKLNAAQKKIETEIKKGIFPVFSMRQKLCFYYWMFKMKAMLKRAKCGDHISLSDYFKLRDMWLQIFLRIYQPR